MTSLLMKTRDRGFVHSMRPLALGIPTFLVIAVFLLWSLARLASWVFAVLDVVK
jgi:hypothetical protein